MLLALLLGIAAFGSYGLSVVGLEIDKMDGIAGNSYRLQELVVRLEVIRRGIAVFEAVDDSDALHDVMEAEARAAILLTELAEFTLSDRRRALFDDAGQKLRAFIADQEQYVSLHRTSVMEGRRLLEVAKTLRAAVGQLIEAAAAGGSFTDATIVAAASPKLLAIETAGLQFLLSNDPAWLAAVSADASTASDALAALDDSTSSEVRAKASTALGAVNGYIATFINASTARTAALSAHADRIRPGIQAMQVITGQMLDRQLSGFKAISEKAYGVASGTLTKQLELSAAATIIGTILALLIARDIIRPINNITAAMTKLASGDLVSEIPGRGRTDEIGEMATAMEVFRQQIGSSEQRLRGLVKNTSDMILICTETGIVTYQSPAAEAAWGYTDGTLAGKQFTDLIHPDDRPALSNLWQQLRSVPTERDAGGTTRTTELRLRDGDGKLREVALIGTNLLNDAALQGIVLTLRDVGERKAFEQQLTKQAFYDALTGLPNRVLFRDRLEQGLVRAARRKDAVGVLFLDLDNFKLVNDSLGHHVGDELLIEAAARLRSCVRAQDTVARLGGDEFVVVLEMLGGKDDAVPLAKAIAHQFSRPFLLAGREIVATASIGIAVSQAGQGSTETLLRDADIAMYRAKSGGRARYVIFDPSMYVDSLGRLEMETDLRSALDREELQVYYQPIVQMETGEFNEVEALVRWNHPTRGLVSPVEFIPIAEETGLIIPLGLWVLEEACRQVVAWTREFPTRPLLTLSVNLSPRQFQQATLVEDVTEVLRKSGLPAGSLKLEITEGIIMRDTEATIRTLWELKELGVRLAIDDFGTGYSSLSYLKRLPLDVLKIDRSFISGIGHNQEDKAIVQAIMALAKSLNLKVTGEGIETVEQAALLGEWGCDRGQGFLYSKPITGQKVGDLLEAAEQAAGARTDAEAATLVV